MPFGIEVIGGENPQWRQQRFEEAAAFDLVAGQRLLQIVMRDSQHGIAEVVLALPEIAMRNICAGIGTSSFMPGTQLLIAWGGEGDGGGGRTWRNHGTIAGGQPAR